MQLSTKQIKVLVKELTGDNFKHDYVKGDIKAIWSYLRPRNIEFIMAHIYAKQEWFAGWITPGDLSFI